MGFLKALAEKLK